MASEVLTLWREGGVTCEWAVGSHELQIMEGEELLMTQPLNEPEDVLDYARELRYFYLLGHDTEINVTRPLSQVTMH